jgi:hypothetical protein
MEATSVNLSTIGEQFDRFLKKLGQPGGSELWHEFVELLNEPMRKEHPPIVLEDSIVEIPSQKMKVQEFTIPFAGISKWRLYRRARKIVKINNWAKDMINSDAFAVLKTDSGQKLFAVSGIDMGFTEKVSLYALFEKAKSLGFTFCPDETALQYCIQRDRPIMNNNRLFYGSEPKIIPGRDTHKHILRTENGELDAIRIHTDRFFEPSDKIIFARR